MGSKEVDNPTTPLTIQEYFNELFTYALYLGMSYELYWYGDPFLLLNYMKANEMKMRNENTKLWLQGYYVYIAVGSLVPVLNPLSKEKKPHAYLDSPLPITDQEREIFEQAKVQKIVRKLDNLVGKKLG